MPAEADATNGLLLGSPSEKQRIAGRRHVPDPIGLRASREDFAGLQLARSSTLQRRSGQRRALKKERLQKVKCIEQVEILVVVEVARGSASAWGSLQKELCQERNGIADTDRAVLIAVPSPERSVANAQRR